MCGIPRARSEGSCTSTCRDEDEGAAGRLLPQNGAQLRSLHNEGTCSYSRTCRLWGSSGMASTRRARELGKSGRTRAGSLRPTLVALLSCSCCSCCSCTLQVITSNTYDRGRVISSRNLCNLRDKTCGRVECRLTKRMIYSVLIIPPASDSRFWTPI